VLVNLTGNAIKFTPRGEIVVGVSLTSGPAGGGREPAEVELVFTIRDTGIGIPADKLPLIFDSFAQVDGSATRRYGGAGLGLAISKSLVELMGGRIAVQSEVGKGTTFSFNLSMQRSPVVRNGNLPRRLQELRGLPVLVVDDNATNRRILEEVLLGWDMRPVLAGSGPEGLALMRRATKAGQPFALVLMDAMMPDMDGYAVIQEIKGDSSLADPTIMMLSSAGQETDAAHCRQLGVSWYLPKPVRHSALLQAICKALSETPAKPIESRRRMKGLARSGARSASLRPWRILLAEDNPVNQKVAVAMLERRGHRVVKAANGREVLAAFQECDFDLILMDVHMPEMDGMEATALIRRQEDFTGKHVPIIAVTANAMKGDRERCLNAGFDDYVSKPIRPEQLFDAIDSLELARTCQTAAVAAPVGHPPFDRTALLARVEGDVEILREMVSLFLNQCPRLIQEMETAIAAKDASPLVRAAHTLKGSVGSFNCDAAWEAAQHLEDLARDGDFEKAAESLGVLLGILDQLKPALIEMAIEPVR
jgi:CheY-like chemotaxis protein